MHQSGFIYIFSNEYFIMKRVKLKDVEGEELETLHKDQRTRKKIQEKDLLFKFKKERESSLAKGYTFFGLGVLFMILLFIFFLSLQKCSMFNQDKARDSQKQSLLLQIQQNSWQTVDKQEQKKIEEEEIIINRDDLMAQIYEAEREKINQGEKDSPKVEQEPIIINQEEGIQGNQELENVKDDKILNVEEKVGEEKREVNSDETLISNYKLQLEKFNKRKTIKTKHSSFEQTDYTHMLSPEYNFYQQKLPVKERFAYTLYRKPSNQNFLQIEQKRFNALYKIDQVDKQLPLCVTIVGYSTMFNYKTMLRSIFRQNYTNFHVVYVDDVSPKRVQLSIDQYVKDLSRVKSQNIKVIFNQNKQYALKNRDNIIRNHCNPGQIIIDLDSDDSLIGNQVFRLLNSFYQKDPELWLFYMSNIVFKHGIPQTPSYFVGAVPDDILEANTYRTSKLWKSHHLRTYKRDLYMKIDQKDFLNTDGEFYYWKADAFILISLSEMAGKRHQKKIDQPVYFYNEPSLPIKSKMQKKLCYYAFKMQTPYLPLSDLSEEAQKTPDYVLPDWLVYKFTEFKSIYVGNIKINLTNYENTLKLMQLRKEEDPQLQMDERTELDENEADIPEQESDERQDISSLEIFDGSQED